MKTQEELERDLHMRVTEVENALAKLNKANLILNHWMHEYAFAKMPDPVAAAKRWVSRPVEDRSTNGDQSAKWFFEYSQIIGFIDIVADYVFESKKLLEKAAYGESLKESA